MIIPKKTPVKRLLRQTEDLFPRAVSVSYTGASPEEVEQGIILVVEEAIRGLDGVKELTATAREGNGTIRAELKEGADRQKLYQEIQQEIDRITTFPDDADEPEIARAIDSASIDIPGGSLPKLQPASDRHDGHSLDFGWLQTYWLFSFSNYHDPENISHGRLRVFNDDVVKAQKGFDTHPHKRGLENHIKRRWL